MPISLYPRYGSVLGGTPVQVFGPCFDGYADAPITCYFDNIEVEGIFVNENYILCISPPLQDLGSVAFTIRLNGVSVEFKEVVFYSCTYMYISCFIVSMHWHYTCVLYSGQPKGHLIH